MKNSSPRAGMIGYRLRAISIAGLACMIVACAAAPTGLEESVVETTVGNFGGGGGGAPEPSSSDTQAQEIVQPAPSVAPQATPSSSPTDSVSQQEISARLSAAVRSNLEWQFVLQLQPLAEIPKYQPGFAHFDYVNPNAPKGGVARLSVLGSGFNSFNIVLPQGSLPSGLGLVYESLMTRPLDQVTTQYGLIAEAFRHPEDYSWVTFRLHPQARWHDGQPITPEDVVWTFEKLVEYNPAQANYYAKVVSAEITGEREVTFLFDEAGNRDLPYIVGQFLVLPKHWWEGVGANGQPRNIADALYEPPLGSGPYRLASFVPGRSVTYTRVEDAWAARLPVNVGQHNFDQIVYTSYSARADSFAALQEDQIDWFVEMIGNQWDAGYQFPAALDGRVVREEFRVKANSSIVPGFFPNTRRSIFQDPVLREALAYAFDFEELLRTTLIGTPSIRIDSYFFDTDFEASGLPQGLERSILEEVRDLVPARVFTQEYTLPVGGTAEALSDNLRTALTMLTNAGYTLQGNRLLRPVDPSQPNAPRSPVAFEILLNSPGFEFIAAHLRQNLAQIGIQASIRTLSASQYAERLRNYDYDMIYGLQAQPAQPGEWLRSYFGSSGAARAGSGNYAGIADPAVDYLIERILAADNHETFVAASRALDRVLLANHFVLPLYTQGLVSRVARWDRFGRPETLPAYSVGFPTVWWWEP